MSRNRAVQQEVASLIDDQSHAFTKAARDMITSRVATAPFSTEERELRKWARGEGHEKYLRFEHPGRPGTKLTAESVLNSLDWHTLKHTADKCWEANTTPTEYLTDLRLAATRSERLHVGRATKKYPNSTATRSADQAATVTSTISAGQRAFSRILGSVDEVILVVYDAGRDCVCTSYVLTRSDIDTTLRWVGRRSFP